MASAEEDEMMAMLWIDALDQFLRGREWQENINTFISAHCVLFVDREAFDHSHYGVFEDFKVMAEGLLEATLSSLGANADRFAKVVEDRLTKLPPVEQERVRALIDVLLTFDDFPTFADMMVEHNMKMQRGEDSAMGSLAAGGNQTQFDHMTQEEHHQLMIQQQLMAEQQAQMQAYAAAQMAGGAPVAYYANPEQAAYMQQQALMAAGAGAGHVPEPPKRTVFGDGAGAGAGAGSSADRVPDPSLGTVVQQVGATPSVDAYSSEWHEQLGLAYGFLQAHQAGKLPQEYASQLLPWATAVVQLSQSLVAAQQEASEGVKNTQRRAELTKLHAFVEQERLKVDLFIARQMAQQNADMRNRLAGKGGLSAGRQGAGAADSSSSDSDIDDSSSSSSDSESEAKALAAAVRTKSRRDVRLSLDEEIAQLWHTSDKYRVAAANRGRAIVQWARRKRLQGTTLEELYLFLKDFVQQGADLGKHAEKIHSFVFSRIRPAHASLVPALLKWLRLEFLYWAAQRRIAQLQGGDPPPEALAASPRKAKQVSSSSGAGSAGSGSGTDSDGSSDHGDAKAGGDDEDSDGDREAAPGSKQADDNDADDGDADAKDGGADDADLDAERRLENLGRVVEQLGTIQAQQLEQVVGDAGPVDMAPDLEPTLAPELAPVPLMSVPKRRVAEEAADADGKNSADGDSKDGDAEGSPHVASGGGDIVVDPAVLAAAPNLAAPRTAELVAEVHVPAPTVPAPDAAAVPPPAASAPAAAPAAAAAPPAAALASGGAATLAPLAGVGTTASAGVAKGAAAMAAAAGAGLAVGAGAATAPSARSTASVPGPPTSTPPQAAVQAAGRTSDEVVASRAQAVANQERAQDKKKEKGKHAPPPDAGLVTRDAGGDAGGDADGGSGDGDAKTDDAPPPAPSSAPPPAAVAAASRGGAPGGSGAAAPLKPLKKEKPGAHAPPSGDVRVVQVAGKEDEADGEAKHGADVTRSHVDNTAAPARAQRELTPLANAPTGSSQPPAGPAPPRGPLAPRGQPNKAGDSHVPGAGGASPLREVQGGYSVNSTPAGPDVAAPTIQPIDASVGVGRPGPPRPRPAAATTPAPLNFPDKSRASNRPPPHNPGAEPVVRTVNVRGSEGKNDAPPSTLSVRKLGPGTPNADPDAARAAPSIVSVPGAGRGPGADLSDLPSLPGMGGRGAVGHKHLQPLSAVVLAPDARRVGAEAEMARVSRQLEKERAQLRLAMQIKGTADDVAHFDDMLKGGDNKFDKFDKDSEKYDYDIDTSLGRRRHKKKKKKDKKKKKKKGSHRLVDVQGSGAGAGAGAGSGGVSVSRHHLESGLAPLSERRMGAVDRPGAASSPVATSASVDEAAPVLSDRATAAVPTSGSSSSSRHKHKHKHKHKSDRRAGRVGRVDASGSQHRGATVVSSGATSGGASPPSAASPEATRAVGGPAGTRPHDASRPLFGADALRMLVAEGAGDEVEEEKKDPAVMVRVGGGVAAAAAARADPLARARAQRVAGPAERRGFSPAPAPAATPAPAPAPVASFSPPPSSTPVPRARVGFDGPPVEGVLRNLRSHREAAELDVAPSGASTVVNPSTRRFLQRWAQHNLGGVRSHVDDDLEMADVEDDFDF